MIAVVGCGHVGLACAAGLAGAGHDVVGVEVDPTRRGRLGRGETPWEEPGLRAALARVALRAEVDVGDADVVVVAVPTPAGAGGPELAAWEDATHRVVRSARPGTRVLVKSTVPVGSADALAARAPGLRVVANPEFLRAGRALADLVSPDRIVLGGSPEDTAWAEALWRTVVGPAVPVVHTSRATAELAKLASNAMLAVRVAFANELTDAAERAGADAEALWRAVGLDPRIGPAHLRPSPGFGGPCLPKDVRLLLHGADCEVVRAAERANRARADRWVEALGRRAPVAVWGLGFRPGTSDRTGSVPAAVVDGLRARGVEVRVWDPALGGDPRAACDGAGVLFVGSAVAPVDPDALRPRRRLAVDPAGLLTARWGTAWSVLRAPPGDEAGDGSTAAR